MRLPLLVLAASVTITLPCAASQLDSVPPARITDLTITGLDHSDTEFDFDERSLRGAPLVLSWTAPGDDGMFGRAWRYDVRIRSSELDDENWSRAVFLQPLQVPLPGIAGKQDSIVVGRVIPAEPGRRYLIGVKTYDEVGNASDLSNVVSFTTPGEPPRIADTIVIGDLDLWVSGRRVQGPVILCEYDNYNIIIGGVRLATDPPHRELTNERFKKLYGKAPFVQNLVQQGVSYREAGYRYNMERGKFMVDAHRILREEDASAHEAFVMKSPLVERAEGGTIYFKGLEHLPHELIEDDGLLTELDPVPGITIGIPAANSQTAESIFRSIRRASKATDRILFIAGGSILRWGGEEKKAQFDAQVAHLYGGGAIETLPPGPLTERMAATIVSAMP